MVKDTRRYTANVEDAVEKLITFKTIDVEVVDSQTQKSENITGPERSFKEEVREPEECLI